MKQLTSTPEWISAFHNGDGAPFRELFDTYHSKLVFFSWQMIDRQDAAEDIVSDTFAKLFRDRKKFETIDHIAAFLYTAARNASLDHIKHIRRKTASHAEIEYLTDESNEDIEKRIIYGDLLKRVVLEIDCLPESQREVMKLAYVEGYKDEEISKQLSLSKSTIRVYKGRGIEFLQNALSKKDIHISNALLLTLLINYSTTI